MTEPTRKIVLLVAVALAGAALFVGWGLIPKKENGGGLVANGTIEATEVEVSSKLPGRLAQLLVKEGDQVQANQVIARLDTSEVEAEVAQQRAALARAEAQLKELLAGSRVQEIEEARANLQQAEDNLKLAGDDWNRFDRLDVALSLQDLAALPGNHFEALMGDRRGQYSIRINDQWRICFEWPNRSPGPVNVEIVDYH